MRPLALLGHTLHPVHTAELRLLYAPVRLSEDYFVSAYAGLACGDDSVFHLWRSANLVYIRKRLAANSAASSLPHLPNLDDDALSSLISLGSRKI